MKRSFILDFTLDQNKEKEKKTKNNDRKRNYCYLKVPTVYFCKSD